MLIIFCKNLKKRGLLYHRIGCSPTEPVSASLRTANLIIIIFIHKVGSIHFGGSLGETCQPILWTNMSIYSLI